MHFQIKLCISGTIFAIEKGMKIIFYMKKIFLLLSIGVMAFSTLTSCSDKDKKNDVVPVVDNSTIVTYNNVSFSLLNNESGKAGRFFSTKTGISYKGIQMNATIVPDVDLGFSNLGCNIWAFTSLDNTRYFSFSGATKTIIVNYPGSKLTPADFDAITNDAKLKDLIIDGIDDDFYKLDISSIILFKNAAGKKGAIKIKSIVEIGVDPRIIVDIKVQK